MKVETTSLSIKHIAEMYYVNGKHFADLYRNKISGYADWCASELCCGFYFNVANIGAHMSLDETCQSNRRGMDIPDQQGRPRRQGHAGGRHSGNQKR